MRRGGRQGGVKVASRWRQGDPLIWKRQGVEGASRWRRGCVEVASRWRRGCVEVASRWRRGGVEGASRVRRGCVEGASRGRRGCVEARAPVWCFWCVMGVDSMLCVARWRCLWAFRNVLKSRYGKIGHPVLRIGHLSGTMWNQASLAQHAPLSEGAGFIEFLPYHSFFPRKKA